MSDSFGPRGAGRVTRVLAQTAVAVVLASTALLASAVSLGPERWWMIALAQYAPYPVLLLPPLAALAVALFLGWPWRVGATAAVLLVATVLMGLEFHSGEPGANRVRVMTFNVKDYITLRQDAGLADIAAEVARHDPDVFVLQDARAVARGLAPGAARGLFGDRQIYTFGQYVVASRFPLQDCTEGRISFRTETHTYVTCVVLARGVAFDLVTAHFMTPRDGLTATRYAPREGIGEWKQNVADRMTQAARLAGDLRARQRPVVVAGDLNAPASSLVVRTLLDSGLRDAFSVAGRGYGYTWGHSLRFGVSFLRLDHILVSREIAVADAFVGSAAGSAHRPVIADLYLERAPQ